jgi:hypothetical protein
MCCLGICLEELKKSTKVLSQDSRAPNRDLNPGPPKNEAGVLTTLQRRSVIAPERRPFLSAKDKESTAGISPRKCVMKLV